MCPSFSNRPNILYLCHDFGAYFNKRIRVRVVKKIFINTNISTLHVTRHNADKHPCSFFRPQTKLWEGNVFTPVCHSIHRGIVPYPSLGSPPPPGGPPPLEGTWDQTGSYILPPPRTTVRILLECSLVVKIQQLDITL